MRQAMETTVHAFYPADIGSFQKVVGDRATEDGRERNLSLAFKVGEAKGIARLLDVEDMMACHPKPDGKSVFLYVSLLYNKLKLCQLAMTAPATSPATAKARRVSTATAPATSVVSTSRAPAKPTRTLMHCFHPPL